MLLADFARTKGAKDKRKRKSRAGMLVTGALAGLGLIGAYGAHRALKGVKGLNISDTISDAVESPVKSGGVRALGPSGRMGRMEARVAQDWEGGRAPGRLLEIDQSKVKKRKRSQWVRDRQQSIRRRKAKGTYKGGKHERKLVTKAYKKRRAKGFNADITTADFARTKGSKDKQQRKKKLLRNVAIGVGTAAALGAGGYGIRRHMKKDAWKKRWQAGRAKYAKRYEHSGRLGYTNEGMSEKFQRDVDKDIAKRRKNR